MEDCTCTVAEILAFCGGINAPGLDRFLAITCDDQLLAIPAPGTDTHTITTAITYRAADEGPPEITAGKFHKWHFSKDDSTWESERDENGLWNTTVKFFIPKMQPSTTHTLNGMTGENNVALVPDRNGQIRLVGAIDKGCMVGVKEVSNPKNGYEVTITWQSAHSPYYYTSTITY